MNLTGHQSYLLQLRKKTHQEDKESHLRTEENYFDGCIPLNMFFAVKIVPLSWSMLCGKKTPAKKTHQSLCSVFSKVISDVANPAFQISVRFMTSIVCLSTLACVLIISFSLPAVHYLVLHEQILKVHRKGNSSLYLACVIPCCVIPMGNSKFEEYFAQFFFEFFTPQIS